MLQFYIPEVVSVEQVFDAADRATYSQWIRTCLHGNAKQANWWCWWRQIYMLSIVFSPILLCHISCDVRHRLRHQNMGTVRSIDRRLLGSASLWWRKSSCGKLLVCNYLFYLMCIVRFVANGTQRCDAFEETKDTITVPAAFMIRMLACIHSLVPTKPTWCTSAERSYSSSKSFTIGRLSHRLCIHTYIIITFILSLSFSI